MYRVLVIFILCFYKCTGVIHYLNDSEYHRMPPLVNLDDYEPCMREKGGTYCMLQLKLYAEPENELMSMIREYSDYTAKHYNHSIIDRGICVKKTCQKYINDKETRVDLTRALEACLNDSLSKEYGLNANISYLYYCNSRNEPMVIDALDWIVLVIILGIVFMNIVGSIYDFTTSVEIKKNKTIANSILLSFSVIKNWQWLTTYQSDDPKIREIQSLHGVRVVSSLCMMLAHVILLISTGYTTNAHDFEKTYELPLYYLIYNGMMIVQVFFFISGFLTVYNLQTKDNLSVWDVPKIMLIRIARLVPTLAVTLAFATTWVRHIGSGPLWQLFVTNTLVSDCRTYWWHTLLFINNYTPKNKYCLLQTWHTAADMQVFLVAVTVYIVARRWRRQALTALLVLGVAAPAIHTVLLDLDAVLILSPETYRTLDNPTYRFQYILGHNNLPCFIFGMAAAALFTGPRERQLDYLENKVLSTTLGLSVVSIPVLFYSGRGFYETGVRPSLLFRALYSSSIRLLLGVICFFCTPGLLLKTTSRLKRFFEWRHWVVPSRLSYCVYLLHIILVHIMMGARTHLSVASFYTVMEAYVSIALVSYVVSLPTYLMVEAPCTALFKTLTGGTARFVNDKTNKSN